MKLSVIVCAGSMLLPAAASAQGISDAQIASIVATANQIDIDAGRLAASNASDARVKASGERMASDHAGVNRAAVELAAKLGLTPQDNATSQGLNTGGNKNIASLKRLSGAAFDRRTSNTKSHTTRRCSRRSTQR
jgi:putative membrane protein